MARPEMSASRFIADLVSSLAWPAVIVVIVVIFHRQFATMLERLAHLRIGAGGSEPDQDWNQTEAVIRQSLAVAGREAGRSIAAPPGAGAASPDRAPQALVEDTWQALAGELRGVLRPGGSLSADQLAQADFDQLMEAALRAGLLDAATVRSLDGLRHLRNLARTNTKLTHRQAQEFALMADALSYGLRRESGTVWPAS
jgi:hypothetical protein